MWLFYLVIMFYSINDAIQTKMLIELGIPEANPLLNWIILKTGTIYSIFIVKSVLLTTLFICLILRKNNLLLLLC